MITGTPCAGHLIDSRLKELLSSLPVIYVKAVPVQVGIFLCLYVHLDMESNQNYVENK